MGTAVRGKTRGWRLGAQCLAALLAVAAASSAQAPMPPPEATDVPAPSDLAILDKQETGHNDLPCTATPFKPAVLGFDLKFHAGYDATVPLKELGGGNSDLTMVFRVMAASGSDNAAYFSQLIHVPKIDRDAKGDATLHGVFDVGEGKYHVSWLMRDGVGRYCASKWDVEATLPQRDKQMTLNIAPNQALAPDLEPFRPEPTALRDDSAQTLNLKLIINFAPQDATSAALQPEDTDALLALLRRVTRDPRIGKLSLVAFNMQEERVVYRQEGGVGIDFPALGEALRSLKLGAVALRILQDKKSDREFLTDLLTTEIPGNPGPPDAVIIAGPKIQLGSAVPQDIFKELGDVAFPVFYLSYALDPAASPWRDAIGNAVRALKGSEYPINKPRDVFFAWSEIAGRIVKSKFGKSPSLADSELR